MAVSIGTGSEADSPLPTSAAGRTQGHTDSVSLSLWQKDGRSATDIFPRVKSLPCTVRGMLLSSNNQLLVPRGRELWP